MGAAQKAEVKPQDDQPEGGEIKQGLFGALYEKPP